MMLNLFIRTLKFLKIHWMNKAFEIVKTYAIMLLGLLLFSLGVTVFFKKYLQNRSFTINFYRQYWEVFREGQAQAWYLAREAVPVEPILSPCWLPNTNASARDGSSCIAMSLLLQHHGSFFIRPKYWFMGMFRCGWLLIPLMHF